MDSNDWELLSTSAGYFWFTMLALWGGTASYVSRMRKKNLPFSIIELIGEWAISGFAGVITFLICEDWGISVPLTAAASGISGHMGGRAIAMIENLLMERVKGPTQPQ